MRRRKLKGRSVCSLLLPQLSWVDGENRPIGRLPLRDDDSRAVTKDV